MQLKVSPFLLRPSLRWLPGRTNTSLLAMCLLSIPAGSIDGDSTDIQPQNTRNQRFTIGILRGDSVIVPFAEYRDGKWLTPWPEPDGFGEDIDNSLADLPAWFDR